MKIRDIILRLLAELPRHTNFFTDSISISNLTYSAGTVTATTSTAHGLVTDNYINIEGAFAKNPISSLTQTDNIATAVTTNAHDLTEGYQTTVKISGANQSEYNGIKTLLSVIDRNTFTFQVTGDPTTPATGTILLEEQKSFEYNGFFQITKIDDTHFSYTITGTPTTPATGTIKCNYNIRISGGIDVAKLMSSYSKQSVNKLWAFVVPDDVTANKSNQVKDDGIYIFQQGQDFSQICLQDFSVFVFIPTANSIASREEYDTMVDVRVALIKALVGYKLDSYFSQGNKFGVVYNGDGFNNYINAYYVHEFRFQTRFEIDSDDLDLNETNTAWRDFAISILNNADSNIIKEISGELDN